MVSLIGSNKRKLEEKYVGKTVKLVDSTEDEMKPKTGLTFKVSFVDDIGQLHGLWENGSSLAINLKCDKIEIVEE